MEIKQKKKNTNTNIWKHIYITYSNTVRVKTIHDKLN